MAFPVGAETIVLTFGGGLTDGSTGRESITITPSPSQIISTALNDIREGDPVTVVPDRNTGMGQVRLLSTDATGYNPSEWTYKIERGTHPAYFISLPHSLGATVDLADLTPVSENPGVYDVLLPASELGTAAFLDVGQTTNTVAAGDDPRFVGGGSGPSPSSTVGASTSFGQSSAAGVATAYSRGDHVHGTPTMPRLDQVGAPQADVAMGSHKLTGLANGASAQDAAAFGQIPTAGTGAGNYTVGNDARLSDSRTPTGAAGGDLSGTFPNPSVAKVAGVAVSGTAASGKVLTASSSSAASWQTPSGGGGGVTERHAKVRITDDNLSGLPSAASWAIAVTSGGTPLQCSIPATAGDRIRVVGRFMYNGAHFLDWVLLDSAGVIAEYAGTETGSPLPEGDPALYPSTSFSHEGGPPVFTVASGNIDGSGNATVALAHQGTSAGQVYAHPTYPWRLRLENIGPEPA